MRQGVLVVVDEGFVGDHPEFDDACKDKVYDLEDAELVAIFHRWEKEQPELLH